MCGARASVHLFALTRHLSAIRPDIGNNHLTALLEGVSRASDTLWHDSVFKFVRDSRLFCVTLHVSHLNAIA
jgi:hypothetical protein